MKKLCLVNMPFASVVRPSLALTQLKAVVDADYKDRLDVTIAYMNHDCSEYMGHMLYQEIADGPHYVTGLGDWFFRQEAFPGLADNSEQYLGRYYPAQGLEMQAFKRHLLRKRAGLALLLDQLITRYGLDSADVVGFTSSFFQHVASMALARRLKARNPKAIVVIGGACCETPMGQETVRHVESFDFVFSGPALVTFARFIGYYLAGDRRGCHLIPGVFSRRNLGDRGHEDGAKHESVPRQPMASNALGQETAITAPVALEYGPFLDSFEARFPNGEYRPSLPFETSRGCWWGERAHCTFCGLNGSIMKFRSMPARTALAQFRALFAYAPRAATLQAVDNILPTHYLQDVLPELETPAGLTIFYEVKANLSEEDVRTLARARVRLIQPGIEALSTATLKLMKKGAGAFTNLLLLKYCRTHGVQPLWNLLIGAPGESEEVYGKYLHDIPLLTHLAPPFGVSPIRFDRYSPHFCSQQHYNLDLHPCDFYPLTYPFGEEALANLAYFFTDRKAGADYRRRLLAWTTVLQEHVERWRACWQARDRPHRPHLFFKRGSAAPVIYDSRADTIVEHQVTETEVRILEQFAKPCRMADVVATCGHLPACEVESMVTRLQDLGLLFEEGGSFLSLVLDRKPETEGIQFQDLGLVFDMSAKETILNR